MADFESFYLCLMRADWTCAASHQGKSTTTKSETIWAVCRRMAGVVHRLKGAFQWLALTDQCRLGNVAQCRRLAPSIDMARLRFLSRVQGLFGMQPKPDCENAYNIHLYPGVVGGFDSVIKVPDGTIKGCHHTTLEAALQAIFAVEGMPAGQPIYFHTRSLLDLMAHAVAPAPGVVLGGGI